MTDTDGLVEIRWHGRGGQGAVTSAEILARAAIDEGKYAQAFPAFGAERRGAPVQAFVRIDSQKPIRVRAEVDQPDIVVVLDHGLLNVVNVTSGLKGSGTLVINTKEGLEAIAKEYGGWRLAVINATKIAQELLGVPIVNTTMLGAVIKAVGVVQPESMNDPIQQRFGRLAERNINALTRAYQETAIRERS